MKFRPLISFVTQKDVQSLAIIEALIMAPLVAFLGHYLLGLTGLNATAKSAIILGFGLVLIGEYARFAASSTRKK